MNDNQVRFFYDNDSDPESFDADKLIINKEDYVLRDMGEIVTIIPKREVHRLEPGSFVEVVRNEE